MLLYYTGALGPFFILGGLLFPPLFDAGAFDGFPPEGPLFEFDLLFGAPQPPLLRSSFPITLEL